MTKWDWLICSGIVILAVNFFVPLFVSIAPPRGYTPEKQARAQAMLLLQCCEAFKDDMGYFPGHLRELVVKPERSKRWRGPYVQDGEIPKDPWGFLYGVVEEGLFAVGSAGPNSHFRDDDDIAVCFE